MKKQIYLVTAVLFSAGIIFFTGCAKDDTTNPVITLKGQSSITVSLQGTLSDPGATAKDDEDGDISSSIISDWSSINPNLNLKGTYTIKYSVSDAAGNTGEATRTVIVVNDADFLTGNYNVNEVCSVTPAFTYTPSVTSSNSVNKQFSISNWGGFYPSQCTSSPPVVICNITGVAVNSTVSWSGATMCGNATVDGSAAFGGGTLTNATAPVKMTINYRWNDGSSSETCSGMYTHQ